MKKVAVIGAGISGLVCAYELAKQNVDVKVFEKGDVSGGRIKQYVVANTPLALGAYAFSSSYSTVTNLIKEMGLYDRMIPSTQRNLGIYSNGRLIKVRALSILFDTNIPLKAKLDLVRLRGLLKNVTPESMLPEWHEISLKDFVLSKYSKGVLDNFVYPISMAFFGETPDKVAAYYGIRIMSAAVNSLELRSGLYPLVRAIESRLDGMIQVNSKVEEIRSHQDGTLSVSVGSAQEKFDIVICCIPVPELGKLMDSITLPNVSYESRIAYIIKGESRFSDVFSLVNGDQQYHIDLIHYHGGVAAANSTVADPDLSPFFKSFNIIHEHKWEYCAPRTKPGEPPPEFETEIPNLYKSGDYFFGGGLESSSKAGKDVAELVLRNFVG